MCRYTSARVTHDFIREQTCAALRRFEFARVFGYTEKCRSLLQVSMPYSDYNASTCAPTPAPTPVTGGQVAFTNYRIYAKRMSASQVAFTNYRITGGLHRLPPRIKVFGARARRASTYTAGAVISYAGRCTGACGALTAFCLNPASPLPPSSLVATIGSCAFFCIIIQCTLPLVILVILVPALASSDHFRSEVYAP